MSIVRGNDRPIQRRPAPWPQLQKLVNHEVGAQQISLLLNEVEPGEQVGLHWHDAEEVIYVAAGRLIASLDGVEHTAERGDAVLIASGAVHGFRNPGPDRLSTVGVLGSATAQTIWTNPDERDGRHLDQLEGG